jgi:hypothetical protein
MANVFATKKDLTLKNGGYLVLNNEQETPVYHQKFVALQQEAHYLVNLAGKVKNVDFSTKKVTTFAEVVESVKKEMATKTRSYVETPKEVSQPLTLQLKDEALAWLNYQTQGSKSEKVNKIMQKFDLLSEFEEFGLYFSTSEIVKIEGNRLYSIAEILEAVNILEPHLTA